MSEMPTYRVPNQVCPNCERIIDALSEMPHQEHLHQGPPQPNGAVTVCLYCAAILELNGAGVLVPLTQKARDQMMFTQPAQLKLLDHTAALVRQFIKAHGGRIP